jgi:hypothetical protein
MNPQDFKALIDEIKGMNTNLDLLWKAVYLLTDDKQKDEKLLKTEVLNKFAPIFEMLTRLDNRIAGTKFEKYAEEIKTAYGKIATEILND